MATFTHQGQALIAKLMAEGKALVIDQMLFAHIPTLDPSAEVDKNSDKPPASELVHEATIYRASFVNQDSVVYSAFLDSTLGFTFNWFGLYCSEHQTLIALEYTEPQKKVKTQNGVYGNNLTKNFVIKLSGAKTLTNIEIPAESWQLNFNDQINEVYQRTEQATEDRLGIMAVATLEEIQKGDSALKAVTPKHLKPLLEEFNRHVHNKHDIGLSALQNYPMVHDAAAGHQQQYASGAAVKQAYDKGHAGLTEATQIRKDLETFVPKRAIRADFVEHLTMNNVETVKNSMNIQNLVGFYYNNNGANSIIYSGNLGSAPILFLIVLKSLKNSNGLINPTYYECDWIFCPSMNPITQCRSSSGRVKFNPKNKEFTLLINISSRTSAKKIVAAYIKHII